MIETTGQERQDELAKLIESTAKAIAEILQPVFNGLIRWIQDFNELMRREYLYQMMPRWIPDRLAGWLTNHWPEQVLPTINWEKFK